MGAGLQDASSLSANAQEPSLSWHFQGFCATLAAGGDLDGANALKDGLLQIEGSAAGNEGAEVKAFRCGHNPR